MSAYVRPLRYNKPANEMLLDIFNFTNKTAVEPWQITFGAPFPMQETEPQIKLTHMQAYDNPRPTQGTLTGIVVKPTPESGWRKEQQLTYRRLVIQDYFVSVPFVIYAVDMAHEVILKALLEQYGLFLDLDLVEFEFKPVDLNDVLFRTHMGSILETDTCGDFVAPIAQNVVIRMKPEHPIFMGEINVFIREAVQFLDRDIKTTLEVRTYLGPGDHNKMPAEMILPNHKFVDHYHVMQGQKVGDLVGEWIVDTAKAVTHDNWVFTGEDMVPFNLYGAKVIYNGLNTGEVYIDDPKVTNLLIIQFSDVYCKNIRGQWIIGYYNRDTWLRRDRIDNLPIGDQ
ncbi:hypothetical protein PA10_00032 [Pseudomonas phage pPa_SNUABM_DT01]|nr:hypothetical protein PA10_00032 [Pseudomonas phage pPa_SNUABM_DT01]